MANIKELLASMIGKINGKLNAPEQAAQPHQQLVTDADGVAKWEDRLAHKLDYVVVLPRTSFVSEQLMGGSGKELTPPDNAWIEPGKTCTVTWDGVQHNAVAEIDMDTQCIVIDIAEHDENDNVIGNCMILFDPNNFVIGVITASDWGTEHTIEIVMEGETIFPIDPKYIFGTNISTERGMLYLENGYWGCGEPDLLYPKSYIIGSGDSFNLSGSYDTLHDNVVRRHRLPMLNLIGASGLPILDCQAFINYGSLWLMFFYKNPVDDEVYKIKVARNGTVTREA